MRVCLNIHSRSALCVPFETAFASPNNSIHWHGPSQSLRVSGFDILISTCTLASPCRLLRATTAICHGVAVKGVNIPFEKKLQWISLFEWVIFLVMYLISFDEIMLQCSCHDGKYGICVWWYCSMAWNWKSELGEGTQWQVIVPIHANQLQFHVAGTANTGSDPQQQEPDRDHEKGNLHGPWEVDFVYTNISTTKKIESVFLVRKTKNSTNTLHVINIPVL